MKRTPKRMDGYVRVSRRLGREGPGYISPDIQREAIQRWAEYRGVEIAAWHFDEDESGGTQARPGLREAMARVEAGDTEGIACWRLNRFARNVAGAIDDVKRVQAANGVLAFVEEDVDPTGPFGEFVLTILLAVATLERENLVQGWKTAKSRAIERGVKIGPTPYGYRRRDDGVLAPDDHDDDHPDGNTAEVVRETFRRAAQEGFESALLYVVEHGDGHRWTTTTLRRLLRSRAYLGEAHYGDLTKVDAHEPLVSPSIWAAAQPKPEAPRLPRRTFPLSGLARCATCGSPLVGTRAGKGQRAYRCSAAARDRRLLAPGMEACAAPANATAVLLEDLVRLTLSERLRDRTYVGGDDPAGAIDEASEALSESKRDLDDLLDDVKLRRIIGADRFRQMAEAAVLDLEEKQTAYEDAARQAERRQLVPAVDLLESAELEELGELFRGALEAVVVEKGRVPLVKRVRIVPRGAPDEVWTPASEDAQSGGVKASKRRGR
jgi:site-specific DNA recombinase